MNFGKVNHPESVDFSFPDIPNQTKQFLSSLEKPNWQAKLYIGATGWSMREWIGLIYPKGIKSTDFLKFYSKQFNTIEFNTTHYRIPDSNQIQKWLHNSEEDFKFCPKLPQTISHRNDLGLLSGELEEFIEAILGLGKKLGSCFIQLPPYFGPDKQEQLLRFLDEWPSSELKLCVEFRHADWFKSPIKENLFEELAVRKIGTVITDVAGRRDVLHMLVTAPHLCIRFVGNGMLATDINRMSNWISLLESWALEGLQEVFFFAHQPDNLLGPEACNYLGEHFSPDIFSFRYPKLLDNDQGGQMNLF